MTDVLPPSPGVLSSRSARHASLAWLFGLLAFGSAAPAADLLEPPRSPSAEHDVVRGEPLILDGAGRRISAKFSENHFAYLFRAHRESGELDEAGKILESWQQEYPQSSRVGVSLSLFALSVGRVELLKGRYAAAEEQFRYALESGGQASGTRREMARVLTEALEQSSFDATTLRLLSGMGGRLLPEDAALHETMAQALARAGLVARPREATREEAAAEESAPDAQEPAEEEATGAASPTATGDVEETSPAAAEVAEASAPEPEVTPAMEARAPVPRTASERGAVPADLPHIQLALAKGDVKGGQGALAALVEQEPGNVEAAALMVKLYRGRGQLDQARALLDRAGPPETLPPCLLFERAQLDAASGRHDEAVRQLKRLLARADLAREDWFETMIHLGGVLLAKGQSERAESTFNEILKTDPHCPAAHYYLGRIHENRRNLGTALACYERASLAARSDHRRPEYMFRMALAYQLVGRQEDRRRALERLATEEPYSYQGRKARQMLAAQLPSPPAGQASLADARMALAAGAPDRAARAFRAVAERATGDEALGARVGLARVGMMARDFANASAVLGDVLRVSPQNEEARRLFGESLYCEGRWQEASEALAPVKTAGAEGARLRYWRGRSLEQAGQLEQAMIAYEEAAHLARESIAARAARAILPALEKKMIEAGGPDELPAEISAIRESRDGDEGSESRAPRKAPSVMASASDSALGAATVTPGAVSPAPGAVPASAAPPVPREAAPAPAGETEDSHLKLAHQAFKSGDPSSSIDHFRRAIVLNPLRPDTYFLLADVLHSQARFAEEKEVLDNLQGLHLSEKVDQQATLLLNRVKRR